MVERKSRYCEDTGVDEGDTDSGKTYGGVRTTSGGGDTGRRDGGYTRSGRILRWY